MPGFRTTRRPVKPPPLWAVWRQEQKLPPTATWAHLCTKTHWSDGRWLSTSFRDRATAGALSDAACRRGRAQPRPPPHSAGATPVSPDAARANILGPLRARIITSSAVKRGPSSGSRATCPLHSRCRGTPACCSRPGALRRLAFRASSGPLRWRVPPQPTHPRHKDRRSSNSATAGRMAIDDGSPRRRGRLVSWPPQGLGTERCWRIAGNPALPPLPLDAATAHTSSLTHI